MKILLTGGLGYIGSHTAVELLNAGYDVVIIDNLSNSKIEVVDKIKQITNRSVKFYQEDLLNLSELNEILKVEKPQQIIHFAGLKAVGESVQVPLRYYENNIYSTINLLKAMENNGINNLIFSSSATVYGVPKTVPITEDFPLSATNPYGRTKLFIEDIIKDYANVHKEFNVVILRYFNPVGAHESGLIGESPNGIPNNLMPYITRVATGEYDHLNIFGDDYPTKDGTGVRDYIHVVDLAIAHTLALKKNLDKQGVTTYNVGTGNGYSVLEMVNAFEKQNNVSVPYQITARRDGDIAECYANCDKAERELGFKAKFGLDEMVKSAYNFQTMCNQDKQ